MKRPESSAGQMDMDRLDLGKLIIREDAESGSAKARNQPYEPGSAGRMRF